MRILQLVQSLARGGAERVLVDMAAAMPSRGHECLVAILRDEGGFGEEEYPGIGIQVLLPGGELRWPGYVPRAARALSRLLREWRPDLLLAHTPNVAAVAAVAGGRVPGIQVIHWHWGPFSGEGLVRLRRRALAKWTFRRLGRRGIVVSSSQVKDSAQFLGCPESRLRCVANGVDLDRFRFVPRKSSRGPAIAVVGSLSPVKRPELAVRAFEVLVRSLPGARLVFAGDGPLRPLLERMCGESEFGGAVAFAGNRAEVAGILQECDLLWHPSRSEGFGLAVAEAMASGLPVVAADVEGIRELVVPGETGMRVPFEDSSAVAKISVEILSDPARHGRMARAARSRIEERFRVDQMVEGYLEAALDAVLGRW
jgi:glycosyltransferase involved in cell wall biosynthesis